LGFKYGVNTRVNIGVNPFYQVTQCVFYYISSVLMYMSAKPLYMVYKTAETGNMLFVTQCGRLSRTVCSCCCWGGWFSFSLSLGFCCFDCPYKTRCMYENSFY